MKYLSKILTTLTVVAFVAVGCDVLDQNPQQSVATELVYTNEDGATAALNGAYNAYQGVIGDDYVFSELAGEMAQHSGSFPSWGSVDQHNLLTSNAEARDLWIDYYELINITNNLITNVPGIDQTGFTDAEKNGIVAEAKVLRALSYHTLVRFFGDVPLKTDPTGALDESAFIGRTAVSAVYDQIVTDLSDAATTLGATGSASSTRITGYTATALLSRVELYRGNYGQAVSAASTVINSGNFALEANYADLFGPSAGGGEAMFVLDFSIEDANSLSFFARPNGFGGRREYAPSQGFINAFDPADARASTNLIDFDGNGAPEIGKYATIDGNDQVNIIRLAELHLIRAEANLMDGVDKNDVFDDINPIRNRAGLADFPVPATDVNGDGNIDYNDYTDDVVLDEITAQRALELYVEGHRWHDLNRLGLSTDLFGIDANMTLWPIPQREIDANPALSDQQNPGY